MPSEIDYRVWLKENVDTTDHEELYSLHHTVEYVDSIGGFDINPGIESENEKRFLTSPAKVSTLVIATEKMRSALLKHVRVTYMQGMDADSWFDFHRRVEQDN